jgi:protein-L-isoaspartate(D-aspartate) O-methyltransferase
MGSLKKMIDDIEAEVRFTRHIIGRDALNPAVMDAMRHVPREKFVPREMERYAFENGPLPIGQGQTISQPYIVALMTDLIEPRESSVVLEVGAGSGYQSAVLSLLVRQVYAMEIIGELVDQARERLRRLGYHNVEMKAGDGYFGWEEHAPYDGIIVAAAAPSIPQPLVDQLAPGGRLVIPVGRPWSAQYLRLVTRDQEGKVEVQDVLPVSFVPLTGGH